jgi:thioredoxin reductase
MNAAARDAPDVAIVGAGPAGLAAAAAAVSAGASVLIIDDNPAPGGQYYRLAEPGLRAIAAGQFDEAESGADLLGIVDHPNVHYAKGAVLHGAFEDGLVSYVQDGSVYAARARALIAATGATERPMPFPGWTLPGIMGAGAVQNLMKSQRMVPGGRIMVAGNGPLMLLAARNLAKLGVSLVAVVEAALSRQPWRYMHRLVQEPGILLRGIGYRARLMAARVPVINGHAVVEARGDDRVRAVDIAPIALDGTIDRSRKRSFDVDGLIVGYGLVPVNELTRSIGCEHRYNAHKGGWIPVRTDDLETTQSGVFAAGECAGIAGMEKARLEGRLAGLSAAVHAGARQASSVAAERQALRSRLARLERFRFAIERLFEAPRSYLAAITPETVICRCEEVTADALLTHLDEGLSDANVLKAATRMGLGRCQGRNCLATQAALIARTLDVGIDEVPWARPRPPLRPVPMGALVAGPAGDNMKIDKV